MQQASDNREEENKPNQKSDTHTHSHIQEATMRTRKEKPIFRNLTITVAGSLINPNGDGSTQWTDVNIDRWVSLRDGRFVRAMSDDVTHVVCTAEEFERRGLVGTSFPFPSLSHTYHAGLVRGRVLMEWMV